MLNEHALFDNLIEVKEDIHKKYIREIYQSYIIVNISLSLNI